MIGVEQGYVLTEDRAIHMIATINCTDALGKKRYSQLFTPLIDFCLAQFKINWCWAKGILEYAMVRFFCAIFKYCCTNSSFHYPALVAYVHIL